MDTSNVPPCCDTMLYKPIELLINGGEGKPKIDIMPIFCLDRSNPFSKMGDALKEIVLPPDVYPPVWEKRNILFDEIIEQALLQANTQLILQRSQSKWNKSEEKSQTLACKNCRQYYDKGSQKSNEELYHNCTNDGQTCCLQRRHQEGQAC